MALFHCLLYFKERGVMEFACAHIDHRWRDESALEAEILQEQVEKAGVPFYLEVLDPQMIQGNLEESCREARLAFFRTLCKKHAFQGVCFGHHQGDQAETVLKRVFEGASLPALQGMSFQTEMDGLTLFRPWLSIPKKAILQFLEENQYAFFKDATNEDAKFLRGRMRIQIFPYLQEHFGKNVESSFAKLGADAAELNQFIEMTLSPLWTQRKEGPLGVLLLGPGHSSFEAAWCLKRALAERGEALSYKAMDTVKELYLEGKANRSIPLVEHTIEIDRSHLFLVKKGVELPPPAVMESSGLFGMFKVEIENENKSFGWQEAWSGVIFLPKDDVPFEIGAAHQILNASERLGLLKSFGNAKVPAFLRDIAPVARGASGKIYAPINLLYAE